MYQIKENKTIISQRRTNPLPAFRYIIWYWTTHNISLEMAEEYKPLIVGQDYSRLLKCIADLHALILPVVESQEVRPAKRTRTGLSVAEREARAAFQLMKEKKEMEIYEFRMN